MPPPRTQRATDGGGGHSTYLVAVAVMLALIGVSFLPTARKLRER